MKTVHILQTADEVIDAFRPDRAYGDDSPYVGPDAVLDFSCEQPLLHSDTCEIRGVCYKDIVDAALGRLHVRLNPDNL